MEILILSQPEEGLSTAAPRQGNGNEANPLCLWRLSCSTLFTVPFWSTSTPRSKTLVWDSRLFEELLSPRQTKKFWNAGVLVNRQRG